MIDIYGLLDETAGTWRQKAAALAADVVARHATEVDTNARFPTESMTALAQGGFYGISARISCNVLKMSGILHGFKMSPSH
jgi:alkylation response protein AidB-like acyl-CoA dehydrogenase